MKYFSTCDQDDKLVLDRVPIDDPALCALPTILPLEEMKLFESQPSQNDGPRFRIIRIA